MLPLFRFWSAEGEHSPSTLKGLCAVTDGKSDGFSRVTCRRRPMAMVFLLEDGNCWVRGQGRITISDNGETGGRKCKAIIYSWRGSIGIRVPLLHLAGFSSTLVSLRAQREEDQVE